MMMDHHIAVAGQGAGVEPRGTGAGDRGDGVAADAARGQGFNHHALQGLGGDQDEHLFLFELAFHGGSPEKGGQIGPIGQKGQIQRADASMLK